MDGRELRGLEIAARCRVVRKGMRWTVPSQSGSGEYTVTGLPFSMEGKPPRCTCPDFELRGQPCKHVHAVRIVIERERQLSFGDDGMVTETETVRVTQTRKTYPQNWPAYNAAQINEKDKFMVLLRDLCDGLPKPGKERKRGRPRVALWDAVFTAVMKVYTGFSARRAMSDLREARERGCIGKVPCHNSVLNALESAALTPILRSLITESSRPLKAVEADFAVDSSGFTTSRFESWFDHKYGEVRRQHTWVKAHVMCGVKTNVVHRHRDSRAERSGLQAIACAGRRYGQALRGSGSLGR